MAKTFERLLDIPRHQEVDLSPLVVPIEFDANVSSSFPIFGEWVVFFDYTGQVFCMLTAFIFDSEIVHH